MGVLAVMESSDATKDLPVMVKTLCASGAAALWRVNLMPVDTLKTTLQVEGSKGMGILKNKLKAGGPGVLYHGSVGAFAATYAGHFPWFATFNALNTHLPKPNNDETVKKFGRNALIGFCSSAVSDTV